jgi:MFS family permease
MASTFSSLKIRNYRLYFIGQLISNTGNWLTNIAIILIVLKISHSGLEVGILAACSFGPILVFTAWAGSIVDYANKRKFLLLTQTLEMLQSFGLAALAFMHHPPLLGFFLLAILGGVFLSFDNPIRRSFVSEMVPKEEIPNAVTLYGIITNGSRVFGPALAGILVTTIGYGWGFTADALSYLVVIFSILRMRTSELYLRPAVKKVKSTVSDGIRYIRSTPELWITFVMLAIVGVFSYNFTVSLPLLITKGLHGSTNEFTILYSIFSLGSVVCALIIAKKRLVQLRHVIIGALSLGVALLILGMVPNPTFALPAGFLLGMTSILYITATTTIMQTKSRPEMLGRVLALQTVFMFGTTPIGGPLLGWLADAKGGRAPILLGGVGALAAGAFGLVVNRRPSKQFHSFDPEL